MIVVIVLSALLTACGGGGGGAGGAAAAAKSFFDAFSQLDFAKMKDLTCDAQKSSLDQATEAMSALGDAAALKEMMKIDTSGLKFEEKSVSGDKATVVVSGKMTVEAFGQSQDQEVNNEELPMVNEGGAWKVCGAGGLPIQ
jgi:Ran GTPase-activating protein (RanGAP) involved in mRNA processing and transport